MNQPQAGLLDQELKRAKDIDGRRNGLAVVRRRCRVTGR